ncbi:MAG: hypothetical protein ACLQM8_01070 [Limisphaerales bacterium]
MSFRVLVIPEDPTHNGYILRPLVERMLAETGRPNARVIILTNPRVTGYEQAVEAIKGELAVRYRHFDLWLFMPDADKARNVDDLEHNLERRGIRLISCAAQPEVEAWLLAGHREHLGMKWSELRVHPRLREEVFEPFLREHGDPRSAGAGRATLTRATLSNYQSLLALCPELKKLDQRLRSAFGS